LSLNPEHAAEAFGNIGLHDSVEEDGDGATTAQLSNDDFYGHAERAAMFPASSIAPRFHAFGFTKLKLEDLVSKTPAERYLLNEEEASASSVQPFDAEKTNALCEKMIDVFTEALGGDKVAASYALFLACARIRLRTEEFPIGSLCVNFSIDCAPSKDGGENTRANNDSLVNALAFVLQTLTPATACLSVDIPSLNARSWVPKKDYDRNRLRAGPLQLADGTVCVLDETKLQSGILAKTGVKNARAVKDIIQVQKAEYDFDYHQMSMPTDISFVAVSVGKSILFSEDTEGLVVPLRPTKNESTTMLLDTLDKQTLDDMRTLVAYIRNAPHMDMSESCGKSIEAAMVQKRQEDPKESTQAKMHSWLTMSRLQSLIKGRKEITVESWEEIMELERTVKNRRRVL
jgi:DNA replicative helicase MCM subunit Mcm2 (Cdc46/Mcm family)